jgi:hypothetical protein
MIPEIDVWRVASLMIKRYGENAEVECARRADEFVEAGDENGAAVWRRVTRATAELANCTPEGRCISGPSGGILRSFCRIFRDAGITSSQRALGNGILPLAFTPTVKSRGNRGSGYYQGMRCRVVM